VGKFGRNGLATGDNTLQRMRFECWINKAKDIHSEREILSAFTQQQWLNENTSMLSRYLYCLPFECIFT